MRSSGLAINSVELLDCISYHRRQITIYFRNKLCAFDRHSYEPSISAIVRSYRAATHYESFAILIYGDIYADHIARCLNIEKAKFWEKNWHHPD